MRIKRFKNKKLGLGDLMPQGVVEDAVFHEGIACGAWFFERSVEYFKESNSQKKKKKKRKEGYIFHFVGRFRFICFGFVCAMIKYVSEVIDGVHYAMGVNAATLSGAVDIVVVQGEDGVFRSTPFHVRFGKMQIIRASGTEVCLCVCVFVFFFFFLFFFFFVLFLGFHSCQR